MTACQKAHKAAMGRVVKPFMEYIDLFGVEKAKGFIAELSDIVEEMKEGLKH